jgi:integrase
MPKRGENIRERKDGRWEARIIAFYKENGKPQYKSIYATSYKEVRAMKKDYDIQKDKNTSKETLNPKNINAICDEWLDRNEIKIKASTYATYHRTVYNHIIPYFQNTEIKDITNNAVQKFINNKYLNGNGLSAKTVHDITTVLLQIIKHAEKEKYISNFDYDVCLPKLFIQDFKILSTIEEQRLNYYLKNNMTPINFGVILAKETGLRIGELCALQLSDLDLENGTITINKTMQRIKNFEPNAKTKTKIVITEPKSKKSVRIIPLPASIIPIAKKLYKDNNSDVYLLTGTPKYIEPRILQKKFKDLMEALNIKDISVHSLRHNFASRAVENGFDVKSLSEILGHATVRFTLEKYVHSSVELKRTHMNEMPSAFDIDMEKMASGF